MPLKVLHNKVLVVCPRKSHTFLEGSEAQGGQISGQLSVSIQLGAGFSCYVTLSFILLPKYESIDHEITTQANACAGGMWHKPAEAKNKSSARRTAPKLPSLLSDALLGPAATQPLSYFLTANRASQKILSGTSQWPQMRTRMMICMCFCFTFRATKQK